MSIVPVILPESIFNAVIVSRSPYSDFAVHTDNGPLSIVYPNWPMQYDELQSPTIGETARSVGADLVRGRDFLQV